MTPDRWDQHWYRIREDYTNVGFDERVAGELADHEHGRAVRATTRGDTMSTNYYLRRDSCPTCGRTDTEVHIGLSAVGWVFLWRGWRTAEESPLGRPLTTPTEWREALAEEISKGAVIVDEYSAPQTLQEFMDFVVSKRKGQDRLTMRRHSDLYRYSSSYECIHAEGDDVGFYEFS